MDSLENRILSIEKRNQKVESDKSWETSGTRKFFVALFTYFSISLYFVAIKVESPFVSALVPTFGFLLSTLSLPYIRKFWEKLK